MATLRQRIHRVAKNLSMMDAYPYITGKSIHVIDNRPKQVKCYIHGSDRKPSARIFTDGKMYCFTCHEMFDSYSFSMKFRNIPFNDYRAADELLRELESRFNLLNIPLEEVKENKNESWDKVVSSNKTEVEAKVKASLDEDKRSFINKWVEVNDKAINCSDESKRQKIFEGLDKALAYSADQKDYFGGWDFLFKLENLLWKNEN